MECFGFLAEARLINLSQKDRALVSSTGVSGKGYIRHTGAGEGRAGVHKGCWEGHIRDLHLLVTLWAAVQGLQRHEGLVSVLGPRGHMAKRNKCWGNSMWSSLAKFPIKHHT